MAYGSEPENSDCFPNLQLLILTWILSSLHTPLPPSLAAFLDTLGICLPHPQHLPLSGMRDSGSSSWLWRVQLSSRPSAHVVQSWQSLCSGEGWGSWPRLSGLGSCYLLFSHSVMSDSLWPHEQQHTRLPCPSLSPRVCSDSCPSSRWCHRLSPPSPPAVNLPQHQDLSQWVRSSHQVAKVVEFQLQHQSFQWIFRVDFL